MRRVLKNWRGFTWQPIRPYPHNSWKLPPVLQGNRAGQGSNASGQGAHAAFMLAMVSGCSVASIGLLQAAPNEASHSGPPANGLNGDVSPKEKPLDPESIMQQVETRIQEKLKSLNLSPSTLSPFTVSVKGQQVSVKFSVSPLCDLWGLAVDVIAHVGKLNNGMNGREIYVSASDSVVAQVMTLELPDYRIQKEQSVNLNSKGSSSNALCIGIFEPMVGEKFPEIEFLKRGPYSEEELDVIINALRIASTEKPRKAPRQNYKNQQEKKSRRRSNDTTAFDTLESMGVKVYAQSSSIGLFDKEGVSWDNLAGYYDQKREIEDTILFAIRCPEVYDSIARGTRRKFESNRPRAILFEGPPGTGKTSSARVIANQAGVPLLYVPLEAVMSKYYSESERMLAKVFNTASDLQDGAIIFLDEIDSLATSRDTDMHEATRRILSVLLRQIDGFEQDRRVIVIAATNRKEDLDAALISRFDTSIRFGLPDAKTREEIVAQYACHLKSSELSAVAAASEGMSGRDLRDICEQAERHWASKVIRNQASSPLAHGLPPLDEYLDCAEKRRDALQTMPSEFGKRGRRSWPPSGPPSVVV